MNATTALDQTDEIVTTLIAGLSADQRESPTPCADWTIHDLIAHMCSGGHMIAGGIGDTDGAAPADVDHLADGPAAGWRGAVTALRGAATPDALAASHQFPFGEVPGEVALSIIVADHLVHGWDLATASGQPFDAPDDLTEWALTTWQGVVPAEGRTGDGFAAAVEVPGDASPVDRLVAYTGRQP